MSVILFYILALLAEIAGTIGGFGSSIFLIPIAGLFFDFETVLAITGVLHVFSNIFKIRLFKTGIDYKLLLLIGIPSVILVFIGALLTKYINLQYAEFILSLFLIVFSLLLLIKPHLKVKANSFNAMSGGSIAGFLAGLIGTGGAIRGFCLAAFDLEKNIFIATSAAIDLGVDATRSVVYLANGYLEVNYYYMIPILLAIAYIGTYIGKLILAKMPQERFKKVVLFFVLGIGLFMLGKFFLFFSTFKWN